MAKRIRKKRILSRMERSIWADILDRAFFKALKDPEIVELKEMLLELLARTEGNK